MMNWSEEATNKLRVTDVSQNTDDEGKLLTKGRQHTLMVIIK